MLYSLQDRSVVVRGECYIAPSASVIGSVDIGPGASIWFNVVIRADLDQVIIGQDSNIQDGSVLHVDEGSPIVIGERVVVGHKVMLHGCTLGDECLIGMNAVVLNGARIGKGSIVGANALIPENMEVPEGVLVLGSPGRIKRDLTAEEQARIRDGAAHYADRGRLYQAHLKPQQQP